MGKSQFSRRSSACFVATAQSTLSVLFLIIWNITCAPKTELLVIALIKTLPFELCNRKLEWNRFCLHELS